MSKYIEANETESDWQDECYDLGTHGPIVVVHTKQLLEKILHAPFTRPAEAVSVAKVLHVFGRLPRLSKEMHVCINLIGPRRLFKGQGENHEISHGWEILVEGVSLTVTASGYFSQGPPSGDSFISMYWSTSPGEDPEFDNFLDRLRIVDDAQPFDREVEQLDLSKSGYSLRISDDGNMLLEDMPDDAETLQDAESDYEEQLIYPFTSSEQRLLATADVARGLQLGLLFAGVPKACDLCGTDLPERALFLDGKISGDMGWGCMCAKCYFRQGEGIGWGLGQLYQRQHSGDWLMIAGFPPKD